MKPWPKTVHIYTDGASRGNPGPCSLGIYVLDEKQNFIYEEGRFLSLSNTNNFAEYQAVIYALELALKNNVQKVHLYSDSEFLVRQIKGEYKVKSENIKPLFKTCEQLILKIPSFTPQHIKREFNKNADALANQALDEQDYF